MLIDRMWVWHLASAGPKVKDIETDDRGVHSAEGAQSEVT